MTSLRRVLLLVTAVLAVVVTYGQLFLGWGQSQAALAASGDSTLRVAGFAFSIWSLLFAWLMVYAVYQILPSTAEDKLLADLGWSSIVAFILLTAWIVAAASDWKVATVVLIFAQWLVLVVPLMQHGKEITRFAWDDKELWYVVWPLSLLAGWLTVAAPVNLVTVATALGALPTFLAPTTWAAITVIAVAIVTLLITWQTGVFNYCLPVAWGLFGAFIAEQTRSPDVAKLTLLMIVIILSGGAFLSRVWDRFMEDEDVSPKSLPGQQVHSH